MIDFIPKQGDIVWLNFNPTIGHEQNGKRPAVIISNNKTLKYINNVAIVCPISTTNSKFPLHIELEEESNKIKGFVLCEQMKTVDLDARNAKLAGHIKEFNLLKVLDCIKAQIE